MVDSNGERTLSFPIPGPAAREPEIEAITDQLIGDTAEQVHPADLDELRRIEGLVVGELREAPVRW